MNSVALITGASRGIGRGIALELSKIGWNLILNYVSNASAAEQTASECVARAEANQHPIRASVFRADISHKPDRERLVSFARSTFGRLDLLVNNAGVAPQVRADILEASEESFDRLISINLKGPYFLTQLVARWMIDQIAASESPASAPKIVTISSVSAYAASVNRGDYCVSKAALSMFSALFAARLAPHGIRVYELRPGIIETDMTAAVREKYDRLIAEGLLPLKRWGTPEDVGKAVCAIAQDLLPYSTGEVLNVDGGFHLRCL